MTQANGKDSGLLTLTEDVQDGALLMVDAYINATRFFPVKQFIVITHKRTIMASSFLPLLVLLLAGSCCSIILGAEEQRYMVVTPSSLKPSETCSGPKGN